METERKMVQALEVAVPLIVILFLACLAFAIFLTIKKRKNSVLFYSISVIAIIVAMSLFSYNEDLKRGIMVHDTFFDGKGTPIGDISKQYSEAVEEIVN